jgi:hypothetical protein
MVTVRQLLELEILHNAKLIAGRKGLDKIVTWVYAKHTKTITPWVHGGEFLLVSGYEAGMDQDGLFHLLDEASMNKISGILIEGGINFKEISDKVINKAEEEEIPLFFVNGVISFLDVTREISNFIMENIYINKSSTSLLDQLLNSSSLNRQDVNQLLYGAGISPNSCFLVASFSISECNELNNNTGKNSDTIVQLSRSLQKCIGILFKELGLKEFNRVINNSVDYLIYAKNEGELFPIVENLKKIRTRLNTQQFDCNIYLSFSSVIYDVMDILNGFNEASFTGKILHKRMLPELVMNFSDIGSYQFLYYIEDKQKLIQFRDHYLKELYKVDQETSSQLLESLREYLIQNGNMLQTAKKLFIHRNTLQYRIDRIKVISNLDLNDFNTRRDLMNAFLILDIIPFP